MSLERYNRSFALMTYKTVISNYPIKPLLALFAVLLLLFSPCPMKASVKMWTGETPPVQSTFSKNPSATPYSNFQACNQSTQLSVENSSKVSLEQVKIIPVTGSTFCGNTAFSFLKDGSVQTKYRSTNGFNDQVPLFLKYQKLLLAFG